MRSLPMLTLARDHDVIPVSGDARLVHRALFREGEADPSVLAFVGALSDAARGADMSMYWQGRSQSCRTTRALQRGRF